MAYLDRDLQKACDAVQVEYNPLCKFILIARNLFQKHNSYYLFASIFRIEPLAYMVELEPVVVWYLYLVMS